MSKAQPNSLLELFKNLEKQGVSKTEYWIYMRRFLENKARKNHIPIHGEFELTPLCNFNCKMCYVHLSDDQFDKRSLLPVWRWKKIADAARSAGLQTVALTGGECLTYPGFEELYSYLVMLGIEVCVMTNGYCINDNHLRLFKRYRPVLIQISVYGSTEDAYEAVTGIRAFKKVYDNIVKLKDEKLPIKLAITPSIYMRGDVEALVNLAESLHIKYGVNPQLMIPRENTGRNKKDLSVDEYLEIYHFLSSIHHENLKTIDWSEVPEENHNGPQRYGIRCGAGRSSFGIKYDGSMCPCLSLPTVTANLIEIGFEKAWERISVASDEYALPLECGDCVYQRYCLSCVAVHNSAPLPGHCDPTVCERMKRLVKEGFIPLKNIC